MDIQEAKLELLRLIANVDDPKVIEHMQQKCTLLDGLARGEKAIVEGRVVSHDEATVYLKRWLE